METVINGLAVIGTSRLRRGDLEGARSALCKAIDFAHGGEFPGATLEAHIGLAKLYAERGEKAKSMQHATSARELSDRASHTIGETALSQSFAQAVAARLGP